MIGSITSQAVNTAAGNAESETVSGIHQGTTQTKVSATGNRFAKIQTDMLRQNLSFARNSGTPNPVVNLSHGLIMCACLIYFYLIASACARPALKLLPRNAVPPLHSAHE